MYNITRQGNTDQYNLISYMCDNRADIEKLPTNCGIGSTCIVIEDSSVWMLGTDKAWKELK